MYPNIRLGASCLGLSEILLCPFSYYPKSYLSQSFFFPTIMTGLSFSRPKHFDHDNGAKSLRIETKMQKKNKTNTQTCLLHVRGISTGTAESNDLRSVDAYIK